MYITPIMPALCLCRGPMVDGLQPSEASDRLSIFQAKFDELWRKYETYSGGEGLFGLAITDYPRKLASLLRNFYYGVIS